MCMCGRGERSNSCLLKDASHLIASSNVMLFKNSMTKTLFLQSWTIKKACFGKDQDTFYAPIERASFLYENLSFLSEPLLLSALLSLSLAFIPPPSPSPGMV